MLETEAKPMTEGADFIARCPDAKAEPEACLTALAARFNITLK